MAALSFADKANKILGDAFKALVAAEAGTDAPPPSGQVYPPTRNAAVALDYAGKGMSYLGSNGIHLDAAELARKQAQLPALLDRTELRGIPLDMRTYGLLAPSMTAFDIPPATVVSEFAGVESFNGQSLQSYLDAIWAIEGGASGGGKKG